MEGVHDDKHNQITWHTTRGCLLDVNQNFTGTPVVRLPTTTLDSVVDLYFPGPSSTRQRMVRLTATGKSMATQVAESLSGVKPRMGLTLRLREVVCLR